jgi:hypothetical protein
VDRLEGRLLLAGDIAYLHGSASDFAQCFNPYWGKFRNRWFAVPGNHEYETRDAAAYFDYFGEAAGSDGTGYYTVRIGEWTVLMLNSNVPASNGTAQHSWVREQLGMARTACTLAVWHHPLFSSGPNGPNAFMRDIWTLLENANADAVVNGHDHLYERFGRQTPDGRLDSVRGIRQFTVGTGGAELYGFTGIAPNSEVRISRWGVLRLTLQPAAFQWEFLTTDGGVADSGAESCH